METHWSGLPGWRTGHQLSWSRRSHPHVPLQYLPFLLHRKTCRPMKKSVIVVTIVLLAVNLLAGLMLSGFKPFNIVFTCVVIALTGGVIYLLRMVPMKDAFVISLSFLFIFFGLVEYLLGILSPNRFQDNGFLLGAVMLLALEGIIMAICSIISKKNYNHE